MLDAVAGRRSDEVVGVVGLDRHRAQHAGLVIERAGDSQHSRELSDPFVQGPALALRLLAERSHEPID